MMVKRIRLNLSALALIIVPLAAVSAADRAGAPQPAAAAPKAVKPRSAAKKPATKPKAMAKSPAPNPAAPYARRMIPPAAGAHPPATPTHSHYDVPQAKNLAETPDVVLNSRVRASLMSALTAGKEENIEPQTVNGVVTLTGSVKTKALRTRAEQVARQVHGVRAVKNQLAVK